MEGETLLTSALKIKFSVKDFMKMNTELLRGWWEGGRKSQHETSVERGALKSSHPCCDNRCCNWQQTSELLNDIMLKVIGVFTMNCTSL